MTTSNINFVQADEFYIEDLDTLKVVADPLRLQIIEIVFDHPHTVKQVGKKLGLPHSKLYYHINMLEKHGLISIASTRMVSGIVEKSYQASARMFRIKRGLLNPSRTTADGNADVFVEAVLENAKRDIKENVRSGLIDLSGDTSPLNLNISRSTTRLTPDEATDFQERLRALVSEFKEKSAHGHNPDQQTYALVTAMYPTLRGARPENENTHV